MEKQTTPQGIEHGLIETIANSIPDHGYKNLEDKNRKEMLERKKRDMEVVKRTYQNMKNQEAGKWEGWYGDHPGEPLRCFRFLHGETYLVPRGLSRKINALGAPVRSGLVGTDGRSLDMDGQIDRTHQLVAVGDD